MSRQTIVLTWSGRIPARFRGDATHPVRLTSSSGHIRFGLGELISTLAESGQRPDSRAVELGLIAIGVWLADTRLARSTFSEDNWTREIDLVVPVSKPDSWSEQAALLNRILGVLSGDRWRVRFYKPKSALVPRILRLCAPYRRTANAPQIALFSGGLDSYTGAINLLKDSEISPVFISQTDGGNSKTVEALKKLISASSGNSIQVIRWQISSTAADLGESIPPGGELTMRARSFLFFAASTIVATGHGSNEVIVPENGFISLNVPLDPWRIGSLTTRTTHPHVIAKFGELLVNLGLPITLSNPFQGLTKGEMLDGCVDKRLLWSGLPFTVSCSKPKWVRRYRAEHGSAHCGTCWPCLIRRAAVARAFPRRRDPTSYVDAVGDNLQDRPGEVGHMARSIQYGVHTLLASDTQLKASLMSVAPLTGMEEFIPIFVDCVKRGLVEVAKVSGIRLPRRA